MDTDYSDKVTAFDALFTTNHIQMLKILLPALNHNAQKQLAIYIKLLELRYTTEFFRRNPHASLPEPGYGCGYGCGGENSDTGSAVKICSEILPFCSPEEKEKVQNIINMCQNIENMQEMMQVMEMLQELSPEMPSGTDGMDFARTMEMLQNIIS